MKKLQWCFVAFLGLWCLPVTLLAAESATIAMETALKLRNKGQMEGAARELRRATQLAQRPAQKALAQLMLGDCLMELKRPGEALAIFEDVLANSTEAEEEAEARFRIAQCHVLNGNLEKSRTACDYLIKKYPASPYADLARFLVKSGKVRTTIITTDPAPDSSAPISEDSSAKMASSQEHAGELSSSEGTPHRFDTPATEESGVEGPSETAPVRIEPQSGRIATSGGGVPAKNVAVAGKTPSPKALVGAGNRPTLAPAATPTPPSPTPVATPVVVVPEPKKAPQASPKPVAKPLPEPLETSKESRETVESRVVIKPSPAAGEIPRDLLTLPEVSDAEREALATEILKAQNRLGKLGNDPSCEEILFCLASQTALFGEHLEACKLYDRLLSEFPSSVHVEQSYFEAIRLRAILKAFSAVSSWGETFLRTFPKSPACRDIVRLVNYAREASLKKKKPGKSTAGDPVTNEPRFREGKRRVNSGKYSLALADFRVLADKYPGNPMVLWELALVEVQLKKYSDAEKTLQSLLSVNAGNSEARSLLGYVHFQQKEYQQAAADYTKTGDSSSNPGIEFFDSQSAAKRMNKAPNSVRQTKNEQGEKP